MSESVDLHGYSPNTVVGLVATIICQAWEMGTDELTLIHGHALFRGTPRPFAKTNTGRLGLTVRSELRNNRELRQWIYAKINVSDPGVTTVRLKPNPSPSRADFDEFPEKDFG